MAVVLPLVVSCGGSNGGGGGDAGGGANVTPAAGGTVVSDDGLVTLVVPPNAVAEPVTIAITRHSGADVPDEAIASYDLSPDGLVFALPARLTRVSSDAELAAIDFAASVSGLGIVSRRGEVTEILDTRTEIDFAAGTVAASADIVHFSAADFYSSPFRALMYPARIEREAPSAWFTNVAVEGQVLTDRTQALYGLLDNPPPFDVVLLGSQSSGVVEVLNDPNPIEPNEHVNASDTYLANPQGRFECPVAGRGSYTRVVVVSVENPLGPPPTREFEFYLTGDALCTEPADLAAGLYDTIAGVEGVALSTLDTVFAVAFGAGTATHDDAGAVDQTFLDAAITAYRAGTIRFPVSGGGTQDAIFSVGDFGTATRLFNPATGAFGMFQALGNIGDNITSFEVIPSALDPDVLEMILIANNSLGIVERLIPDGFGTFTSGGPLLTSSELLSAGVNGNVVDLAMTGPGTYLGTTDRQIFSFDGTTVTPVGAEDPGAGFRLLDCDGMLCGVANFSRGDVTSFFLDASGNAQLPVDVQAVDGPVGIDVSGSDIAAAGSNDGTLHLITRELGLAPVHRMIDVSGDCPDPSQPVVLTPGADKLLANCRVQGQFLITPSGAFGAP